MKFFSSDHGATTSNLGSVYRGYYFICHEQIVSLPMT